MATDERFCAAIQESTARLAGIVAGTDESTRIPTCPDWALRQLATHVGRAHRWAAEMVTRRVTEPISFRDVPDGRLPDDPAARPDWLTAGAARLTGAVSAGGTAQVWTLTGIGPGSFWARRMAHETAMHLADAELAVGQPASIPADLAADGIGEWLMLVSNDPGEPPLPGEGQSLHLHPTDDGLDGTGEWLVRRSGPKITVEPGHGRADVAVRGPAAALLLVLLRRLSPAAAGVEVLGDEAVLSTWLERTPF